jgi:hypothetical protein
MGLVRFALGIFEDRLVDKSFFHFFSNIFERVPQTTCRPGSPFLPFYRIRLSLPSKKLKNFEVDFRV